jgi:endonuclease/exonuclease/phosphatase family metal-dependent hydrolase
MIFLRTLAILLALHSPAAASESRLVGFARLPAGTLANGSESGRALIDHPRALAKAPFPGQPIQGFSALVPLPSAGKGAFLALCDNGYGGRDNSADFELRVYVIEPDFERGEVRVLSHVALRDPAGHVPFPIVRGDLESRPLTGADFDPESLVRSPDGSWWIGEEFGPFLMHFDAAGELLEAPVPLRLAGGARFDAPDSPLLRDAAPTVAKSAGFEALALAPDGTSLLAILEKPRRGAAEHAAEAFHFDLATRRFTPAFALPLDPRATALADAAYASRDSLLAIERDDSEGRLDGYKALVAFDLAALRRGGPAHEVRKPIADLLAIADPDALAPCGDGDVGCGEGLFALPFHTIESLVVLDAFEVLVGVDNNFPFSRGRHVGSGAPDDSELVMLRLERPLTPQRIRIATYNVSLFRAAAGELRRDLEREGDDFDAQARAIAATLRRVRPDVVVLQEFDRDPDDPHAAVAAFQRNHLAAAIDGLEPLHYEHVFVPETNTGIATGLDVNRDGRVGGDPRAHGEDARGFGAFAGQYGMVVLSRFPLRSETVRTFRELPWRDAPSAVLPDDATTPSPADFFTPEVAAMIPLSSKNHFDLAVDLASRGSPPLHLLVSHPTPPAFDGPEDRNGLRNAAEIAFWIAYLDGAAIRDDRGRTESFPKGADFVLLGDLNADPHDGTGRREPIAALLGHPRLVDPQQASLGARLAAIAAGRDAPHAARRTADFADPTPGGPGGPGDLRVDYVLPSRSLRVVDAGVFWPAPGDPAAADAAASDHRLVFVDVAR